MAKYIPLSWSKPSLSLAHQRTSLGLAIYSNKCNAPLKAGNWPMLYFKVVTRMFAFSAPLLLLSRSTPTGRDVLKEKPNNSDRMKAVTGHNRLPFPARKTTIVVGRALGG